MRPTLSLDHLLPLLTGLILGSYLLAWTPTEDPSVPNPSSRNLDPDHSDRPPFQHALCRTPSISNAKMQKDLEEKADQMIQKKRYTPMKKLLLQMKRTRCRVPLRNITGGPAPDMASLYRKRLPSMLIVGSVFQCGHCIRWHVNGASGFVLSAEGIAVTNHHVVHDPQAETLFAATAEGAFYPVTEILATDPANDIAIIRLDAKGLSPLSLAKRAPIGTSVRVISHADSHYFFLSEGIISGYYDSPPDKESDSNHPTMLITADYAKGSSGAPILDSHGNVVGMVRSTRSVYYHEHHGKQQDLQMVFKRCVPVEQIRALIESP